MKTTQEVARDFFNVILEVMSKNSSRNYALLAIGNIKKKYGKKFPFLKHINVTKSSVRIDSSINSVDTHEIAEIFEDLIRDLGPNILRMLLKEKLDRGDKSFLQKIGVYI